MFSSQSSEWGTAQYFFDRLNKVYKFTLDPAATPANAKCAKFFTAKDDGLAQDWSGHVVFCNPPYGRQIKRWVQKCYEEGCKPDTTVVMLIPARTDTQYFHQYCMRARKIYFVRGRLKFIQGDKNNSAPFPSMVVVFDGIDQTPEIQAMDN